MDYSKNLLIFRQNEIVQVVDECTFIWESAKIIGHESDWSVRVKWVDWSSKPATVIIVPTSARACGMEHWNIRKFQNHIRPVITGKRQRRAVITAGNYQPFTGNPAKLPRYDRVCLDIFFT